MAFDMSKPDDILDAPLNHPYLSGNFAPIHRTFALTPCSSEGEIPADLAGGQYVRNGANPLSNGDSNREAHWFDGDGMVSGVLFRRIGDDGAIQPEFVNQYLVTDVYAYAKGNRFLKKPVMFSITTLVSPCTTALQTILAALRTVALVVLSRLPGSEASVKKISVANTAILYHDGRALATCESGPPLRVALPSLETIGWFNGKTAENEPNHESQDGFGGRGILSLVKEWTTAHPRVDPVTNELITFHSVFVKPYVYYSIIPPTESGRPARFNVAVPGVASPKMMHDFGVSRNHIIIMDLPLSLDPFNITKGRAILSYDAAARSRFGIFPRYEPDRIQWFETNPCCIFHTANCWNSVLPAAEAEEGLQTVVNLLACRLTTASFVFSAGNVAIPVAKAAPSEYAEEEQCRLYYYSFPLPSSRGNGSIASQWALSTITLEFPIVSPLHAMTEARYVYGCSTSSGSFSAALGKAVKIDMLAKIDVARLIAQGLEQPPQSIKGCVDTRSAAEIMASDDVDDAIKLFKMPEGCYAQEARFVPRSNAMAEDDGWLLSYVFDESQLDEQGRCRDEAISELWIIDARGMKDVIARVKLPQRVPYGFHGSWFSEDEILAQRLFDRTRELSSQSSSQVGGWWSGLRSSAERWIG
ncbi:retinal pigment epithelial membrane protein [Bombardia bombarda]|uniref:Retinal pigment epithelial membrane protein n=1 Tax=Bombardia bombarda TaxID=252184 RepID=A0AA39X6W6_9PEZI|nr:retinal pigment epithelial membrane protein [Bombardia bombarda]